MVAAASPVPALFSDVPRNQGSGETPSLAGSGSVCVADGDARFSYHCLGLPSSERIAALEPGPGADVVPGRLLCGCDGSSLANVRAGDLADSASADEVGDPWNVPGSCALHGLLCHSVFEWQRPGRCDEGFGAIADLPAAHVRLRDLPLPPDGRGPDLQARHGLHAGGRNDHWYLFRGDRCGLGDVPQELPECGSRWVDG